VRRFIVALAPRRGIACRRGIASVVALAMLWAPVASAQAPAAPATASAAASPQDLDKLVDRIALYPDDLVAIILPASTNPLQIVQAERFLAKRKSDPKAPLDDKWDDSVKSLLNYPEVVTMMSGDLDWTSALGEAVVADQGAVLDAIQAFRRKAQAAGNLKSDGKQTVVVEKEVVTIVPADPQVIYVPQYNPTTVVVSGSAAWGYYPNPYPVYYYPYPPGAALATGIIWGAAIGAIWGGNHYGAHYGGNANINVNRNTNINTGDINRGNNVSNRQAGGAGGGGSTAWKSNKQPGQVSSSVGASRPARAGDGPSAATANTRQAGGAGSAGVSARGGEAAGGGRAGGSAGPSAGNSAFDGYSSGRQTQMDSSRGASSRSTASHSASPSSSRGMSGGGGGGRGGGGGGRGGGGRR
jgi:hypothetical protein